MTTAAHSNQKLPSGNPFICNIYIYIYTCRYLPLDIRASDRTWPTNENASAVVGMPHDAGRRSRRHRRATRVECTQSSQPGLLMFIHESNRMNRHNISNEGKPFLIRRYPSAYPTSCSRGRRGWSTQGVIVWSGDRSEILSGWEYHPFRRGLGSSFPQK
jgi:hypothetical protein